MRPPRSARLSALAPLLCAAILAFTAAAFAQQGESREMADFTFGGPVVSVDVAKRTITIGGDTGGTFEVDAKATLMSGDRKLTLGDVKVGWNVQGDGDLRGAASPKKVITYLEHVDE